MEKKQQKGLGKGLSALIASGEIQVDETSYNEHFDINKIAPNPFQPRMKIDPADLVQIADSIRANGIIQPLIITKNSEGDNYNLIAGERRFRAAQLAGLKSVPVVIKDSSPQQMLELALIENIQRQDLNPVEEANAFRQLQDQFGLTQTDIARKVGLSRVSITNKIRLLALPPSVREAILNNLLSEGHARALLGITDESSLVAAANIVLKRNLSVRETEDLVRKINFGRDSARDRRTEFDDRIQRFAVKLSRKIGLTVRINKMTKGGKIVIRFLSNQELEEIMEKLMPIPAQKPVNPVADETEKKTPEVG